MKTKKLVSLFLAVAMIFAVLTVVVSANFSETTGESNGTYCRAEGILSFIDSTRKATATIWFTNTSGTVKTFRVGTQCTINYSDYSYDFGDNLDVITCSTNNYDDVSVSVRGSSSKTITSVAAEYQIGDSNSNLLWEDYISKNYVLGIDA